MRSNQTLSRCCLRTDLRPYLGVISKRGILKEESYQVVLGIMLMITQASRTPSFPGYVLVDIFCLNRA